MKNYTLCLLALMIALSVGACTTTSTSDNLKIERAKVLSLTATVEAIDMQTRKVTLKGPSGNMVTVMAGEKVRNLPQVQVGDKVMLDYVESLVVRMANPGEVRDETSGLIGAAEPGSKPGVLGATETTVSATIEAIDKKEETVTLKGPDGGIKIVKVQDPANLKKVKVGDTIVITYTEAVALSVQAVNP